MTTKQETKTLAKRDSKEGIPASVLSEVQSHAVECAKVCIGLNKSSVDARLTLFDHVLAARKLASGMSVSIFIHEMYRTPGLPATDAGKANTKGQISAAWGIVSGLRDVSQGNMDAISKDAVASVRKALAEFGWNSAIKDLRDGKVLPAPRKQSDLVVARNKAVSAIGSAFTDYQVKHPGANIGEFVGKHLVPGIQAIAAGKVPVGRADQIAIQPPEEALRRIRNYLSNFVTSEVMGDRDGFCGKHPQVLTFAKELASVAVKVSNDLDRLFTEYHEVTKRTKQETAA